VNKSVFRASLMTIFLLIALVRLPSYLVGGLITPDRFWSALSVVPAVAVGSCIGGRIHFQLSEEKFRRAVSVVLLLIGLLLLLRTR